jgi:hypothetical protein
MTKDRTSSFPPYVWLQAKANNGTNRCQRASQLYDDGAGDFQQEALWGKERCPPS